MPSATSKGPGRSPPEAAACETDMMQGVITGGTGTAARAHRARRRGEDRAPPTAAPTPTSSASRRSSRRSSGTGNALARIPGAGFGGQIPARIWKRFMQEALYGQPALPLPDPGPLCDVKGAKVSENGRGVPGSAERTTPQTIIVPPSPVVTSPPPRPIIQLPPLIPTTTGPPPPPGEG